LARRARDRGPTENRCRGNLIDDHRFADKRPKQIEPIKKVITKPTLVEAAAIKQRKQVALDPKDGQGSQAGRS
jgi:hypothetical protein